MNTHSQETYKLTQYSHGAGCGCKISPAILQQILHTDTPQPTFEGLWVGNETKDDAAAFSWDGDTAIISTTDFFMPIVDDGFDFGRIASVNAISDVYAMGGTPLMAIAILGWPIDKLPPSEAARVVAGGREACKMAGIPLAGGHSIDCPEPIFGLAVSGRVHKDHLKQNSTAEADCLLYLTKPLGVGILSTAQKKGILRTEDQFIARDSMVQLNRIGEVLGKLDYVTAMTDVTGFGLLGHLKEMCEGSSLSAEVYLDAIPRFDVIPHYLAAGSIPGGTKRNWASYGHVVGPVSDDDKYLLADPQTSGGLLVAVKEAEQAGFENLMASHNLDLKPIGRLAAQKEPLISVL